jgi:parafibromin
MMFINDATKEIMSKERVHRTRSSVLLSTGKDFSNIFSLLQSVKARDEGEVGGGGGGKQPVPEEPRQPQTQAPPTHGYSRYGQEKFRGQEETGEFKIDTTSTYHGLTLKSVTEAVSKPKPMVQSKKTQIQKPVQQDVAKPARRDHRSRTPIIIVPSATTSLVTMLNVKTLLEEYKFVPSEEMKRSGVKRQMDMVIQRRKPHPTQPGQTVSIPYRVTDSPMRLKPPEWKQVVAVFVAGPAWQFKGWPGLTSDASPVNIFSKIKAFHLRFEESRLDPNIQKWDVHLLQISQNRRHLDKQSIMRYWETLDRFISQHQLDLRY